MVPDFLYGSTAFCLNSAVYLGDGVSIVPPFPAFGHHAETEIHLSTDLGQIQIQNLVKDVPAEELAVASVPACIYEVADFILSSGAWEGRTKKLMGEAGIDNVSPAFFGKYLAQHFRFLEKNGVRYSKRHTSSGSLVTLERIGDGDSNDGNL